MELHASFNTVDYVVFATILVSGLLAIFTGFVREIYSLFNWSASYFIGVKFYFLAEPFVKKYISNPKTVTYASIFIVFCICFIVLGLIGRFIVGFIKGEALTAIDRSLGFVFGIVRGYLIVCLIYLVTSYVLWPDIDKPQPAPDVSQQHTETKLSDNKKEEKKESESGPPSWLLHAKTRPMLAFGSSLLKEFVPEKTLEKTTEKYLDEKDKVHNKVDEEIGSTATKKTIEHFERP